MKTLITISCLLIIMGCGAKKVITSIDKSTTESNTETVDKGKSDETKTSTTETNVKSEEVKSDKGGSNSGLSFTSDKPVKITKGGSTYEFTPNGLVSFNESTYYESLLSRVRDSSSRVTDSLRLIINNDKREINELNQKLYSKDKNTDKEGNARPWALAVFGAIGLAVIAYFVYKYFTNPKRLVKN